MDNEILTENEIREILQESTNLKYSDTNVLSWGYDKLSIQSISPKSGLILIYGNEYTGLLHISQRHCFLSRKPYWREDGTLDDPTKFPPKLTPVLYLEVASEIFKPKNVKYDGNKYPDRFDVYESKYLFRDSKKKVKYRLITYKDTGIIHTMFIIKYKPFNSKIVLNLAKGPINVKWIPGIDYEKQITSFSYYNQQNEEVCNVKIVINDTEMVEKWFIQMKMKDKPLTIQVGAFQVNRITKPSLSRINEIENTDLGELERIINEILKNGYS